MILTPKTLGSHLAGDARQDHVKRQQHGALVSGPEGQDVVADEAQHHLHLVAADARLPGACAPSNPALPRAPPVRMGPRDTAWMSADNPIVHLGWVAGWVGGWDSVTYRSRGGRTTRRREVERVGGKAEASLKGAHSESGRR